MESAPHYVTKLKNLRQAVTSLYPTRPQTWNFGQAAPTPKSSSSLSNPLGVELVVRNRSTSI